LWPLVGDREPVASRKTGGLDFQRYKRIALHWVGNGVLDKAKGAIMPADFISNLYVFILAGFVGFELIKRVSPLLHTPLMSLTNALDAIVVVAAIIIAGRHETLLTTVLGAIAVAASFSNMVGGFLITDRMLRMFKSGRSKKS
jgi:H+-translocating NAD(P) transhydrogenase subunit alpha